MTSWQGFAAEIGLRRAAPKSLGWPFAGLSVIGALLALGLGKQLGTQEQVSWLLLASLILWQPLVEEVLFRGVLQGALLRSPRGIRRIAGLTVANIATSIAFVLVHLVHQPVPWALGVFLPSLLFGLVRERSGSLWPPLLMHVLFNLAFFVPRFPLH